MLTEAQTAKFIEAVEAEGHLIADEDVIPTRETVADWTEAQGRPVDRGDGLLEYRVSARTSVFIMDFGDVRATVKI